MWFPKMGVPQTIQNWTILVLKLIGFGKQRLTNDIRSRRVNWTSTIPAPADRLEAQRLSGNWNKTMKHVQ